MVSAEEKVIYWHRELPPLDAEPIGEHALEVDSMHVPGTIAHRDELWDMCYTDLMSRVAKQIDRELQRLGGVYAHVLNETVNSKRNDIANEAWLHGSFTYVVYCRPAKA